MKTVVLLCGYYPSGKGETFLKNEIESGVYDDCRLIVFSLKATQKDIQNVPLNVECFTVPELARKKIIFPVFSIFSSDFTNEIMAVLTNRKNITKKIKSLFQFIYSAERLRKYVFYKMEELDIDSDQEIVFYSYWMHTFAYVAAKCKEKYKNSRFVTRCHRFDLYEEENGEEYLPFRKYILNNADIVFPISEDGKNYLVRHYKKYINGKIQISYLGTYDYGENNINMIHKFTVVTCSNVVPVKRIELVVKALSNENIEMKWIHLGDGPLLPEIKNMVDTILPNNVETLFLGHVENTDVMGFYRETPIDLFLNVSNSEGLPVSIMEAMSFGIPVIATEVGGTAEIVKDEINGFLLNKGCTDEDIRKKIDLFINLPNAKKMLMRQNARKVWKESFSASENFKRFSKMILD